MKEYFSYYADIIIKVIIAIIVIATLCYLGYSYIQYKNEALQRAVVLTQEQASSITALENKLKIDTPNAELLKDKIVSVEQDKVKPEATFVQKAETVEDAAKVVATRINAKDETLPASFLEKADRKLIVPTKTDNEWQVNSYSINLRKRWEAGGGLGVHKGNWYVPLAIKDNYSKNDSVTFQVNTVSQDSKPKIDGGQIVYMHAF